MRLEAVRRKAASPSPWHHWLPCTTRSFHLSLAWLAARTPFGLRGWPQSCGARAPRCGARRTRRPAAREVGCVHMVAREHMKEMVRVAPGDEATRTDIRHAGTPLWEGGWVGFSRVPPARTDGALSLLALAGCARVSAPYVGKHGTVCLGHVGRNRLLPERARRNAEVPRRSSGGKREAGDTTERAEQVTPTTTLRPMTRRHARGVPERPSLATRDVA